MTPDHELLHRYAKHGDEAAFAEVVRRQVNLVYAVALRVANGNAALAEDATQSVFTDLARKAGPLSRHPALAGWLHTSARFAARKAIRGEQRRQTHEREAAHMHAMDHSPAADWDSLRPLLDDAVGRLREDERAVVVLRFFQGLNHADVGNALGINENTARKRADRALEKLRTHFARVGVVVTAELIASTVTTQAAPAAPVGLAERVTKPALAGAAAGAGTLGGFLLSLLFMSTKTKITLGIAALVAFIACIVISLKWQSPTLTALPTQPTSVEKPTMSKAPPAATIAAASLAKAPTPAAPATQVSSAAPETPAPAATSASTSTDDPHDSLKTALADIARLYRAGNLYDVEVAWMPPEVVASWDPQNSAKRQQLYASMAAHPNAMSETTNELIAEAMVALEDKTPTYNDTGDEATYSFTLNIPVSGIIQDAAASKGNALSQEDQQIVSTLDAAMKAPHTLVMVKINGKWYAKSGL